jgi:hypothetical protein
MGDHQTMARRAELLPLSSLQTRTGREDVLLAQFSLHTLLEDQVAVFVGGTKQT